MPTLVFFLLVFLAVGVFFLFFHLMLGLLVRPVRREPEKLTIYECGEPTIGSAWVQFDLRYYVVALLFVIFDVEVAFFFPWAVVFGKSNTLATAVDTDKRTQITAELVPSSTDKRLYLPPTDLSPQAAREAKVVPLDQGPAYQFAVLAMIDIAIFFGVLLVGFAYLWKRGDIDWVRSIAAERQPVVEMPAERATEARGPPPELETATAGH
jgi:NADH-quinone oxidoreductase subunit A